MGDFIAITSQEQLDTVIGDRLKRAEEKWQKKYEGYASPDEVANKMSDLQKQLTDTTNALDSINKKSASYEKDIAEKDAKIKGYEISSLKHKIAHESGLSYDSVEFIQGEDEDSIRASADKFKSLIGKQHSAPAFRNEPDVNKNSNVNANIKKLAENLTKK